MPSLVVVFALNMIASTLMVRTVYPSIRRKNLGKRTAMGSFGLVALAIEGAVTIFAMTNFGTNSDILLFGQDIKDVIILSYAGANCLIFFWFFMVHRSDR